MTLSGALARLRGADQPVLRTTDAAALLEVPADRASTTLSRLAKEGHILRLKRGLWTLSGALEPLAVVQHLTAPFPSYVSMQTALYHHGLISQIPAVIYLASLARTRTYQTPVGAVSVHHLPASFFFGYEGGGAAMASPEKALMDFLYLTPARSRLFAALPETDLSEGFDEQRARAMVERVPSARRRTMVHRRLDEVLRVGAADQQ